MDYSPTRLLFPWDFLGENTGLGSHFFLQGNLPDPGTEPTSPALAGGFFTTEPPGKPQWTTRVTCHSLLMLFLVLLLNIIYL